jgi:hypothetical protein
LDKKKDLINTQDVILKSCYLSPAYVSPAKKIQIIKNPAAHLMEERSSARHFSLWLKVEGRGPLFLGNYAEQRADDLKRFITGSADERYLFIGFLRKVISSDGAMMVVLNDLYTSPVWYEDILFLRGRGENDAVYSLNLKTKKFKKFLEVSGGLRFSEVVKGEMLTWDPVTVENGLVNVSFTRIDLHPTEKGKHCMTIAITADQDGRTVKENIRWDPCNS